MHRPCERQEHDGPVDAHSASVGYRNGRRVNYDSAAGVGEILLREETDN